MQWTGTFFILSADMSLHSTKQVGGLPRFLPPAVAKVLGFLMWGLASIGVVWGLVFGLQGKWKDWPVLEVLDFHEWKPVPATISEDHIAMNRIVGIASDIRSGREGVFAPLTQQLLNASPETYSLLTNNTLGEWSSSKLNVVRSSLVLALNRAITNGPVDNSVSTALVDDDLARANVRRLHEAGVLSLRFRSAALAPLVILLILFWTLVALALQFLNLRREQATLRGFKELTKLPQFSVTDFQKLAGDPARAGGRAAIVTRAGLERRALDEALSVRAGMDAGSLAGAYTALRVYIWVLPVIGFVGTAMGLSESIEGFKSALKPGATLETLMATLNQSVIPGLADSFYVTIIALLSAAVGHYCMTMLQAWDEELLEGLDHASLELINHLPPESATERSLGGISQFLEDGTKAAQELLVALEKLDKWVNRKPPGAPGT